MRSTPVVTWVVYERHIAGKPKMTLVCEQAEWDALILAHPDSHVLVGCGIVNEGEAEQLARRGAVVERIRPPLTPSVAEAGRDAQHAAVRDFWARAKRCAATEKPSDASCVGQ